MNESTSPFDPNSLSNEEYFEWLNKQQLSKREYYRLFFARLKRKKINLKEFEDVINWRNENETI